MACEQPVAARSAVLVVIAMSIATCAAGCGGGDDNDSTDAGSDATEGGMDADTVCHSDRECSGDGLVCDRTVGRCVECRSDMDCGDGQACLSSECRDATACTSSRMCDGLVCDVDAGYCVECLTDVDCPGEDTCEDRVCVPPPRACESDRQCSDIGLVCDTELGHCVECVAPRDCPEDRYCSGDGTCLPDECSAGATRCATETSIETCVEDGSGYGAPEECAPGRVCRDTACVATDAGGLDAGNMDAGGPDAGEMDAGAPDAGADGGVDAAADSGGPTTRYALSFDGDGDEVEFPMSIGDLGDDFTFEAWIRPTSATYSHDVGGYIFIHQADCSSYRLEWSRNDSSKFGFVVYPDRDCSSWVRAVADSTSTLDEWHHVAAVFDAGELRLYVNGSLSATEVQPSAIAWETDALFGHWAGRDGSDSRPDRGALIGDIDELRISDSARYSGDTISPPEHFTADADTVALWMFDEGSGSTANDDSPNGFDGTITGATWIEVSR